MISGYDKEQLDEWKANLYSYEKQKRTKKPFHIQPSVYENKVVHSSLIKEKQRQFDPIIQKYNKASLQRRAEQKQQFKEARALLNHLSQQKHAKNYDIVNLHAYTNEQSPQSNLDQWSKNKNKNNPIRNLYNIINNQSTPMRNYMNRKVKLSQKPNSKRVFGQKYKQPDFDVVKALYVENNEQKIIQQAQRQNEKIKQKLGKSHHFDNIFQRYYDAQKQVKYQQELSKARLQHGRGFDQRLPPSYRNREPFIHSHQGGELNQALKTIKQNQQNALKRSQLRYALENQYRKRNDQDYERQLKVIKNRVHQGKIFEEMIKQHDIISNKPLEMNRSILYKKKINQNPYSHNLFTRQCNQPAHVQSPQPYNVSRNWQTRSQLYPKSSSDRYSGQRFSIKSGGFN